VPFWAHTLMASARRPKQPRTKDHERPSSYDEIRDALLRKASKEGRAFGSTRSQDLSKLSSDIQQFLEVRGRVEQGRGDPRQYLDGTSVKVPVWLPVSPSLIKLPKSCAPTYCVVGSGCMAETWRGLQDNLGVTAKQQGRDLLMTRIPAKLFRDFRPTGPLFTVGDCGLALRALGCCVQTHSGRCFCQILRTAYEHKEMMQWRAFNLESKGKLPENLDMFLAMVKALQEVRKAKGCLFETLPSKRSASIASGGLAPVASYLSGPQRSGGDGACAAPQGRAACCHDPRSGGGCHAYRLLRSQGKATPVPRFWLLTAGDVVR
jgi:hypothetical protein